MKNLPGLVGRLSEGSQGTTWERKPLQTKLGVLFGQFG